jgi:hypothetical protein
MGRELANHTELFVLNCLLFAFCSDMRSADSKPKTKAPDGEGCPRCGYHVFAAEQMLARGRVSPSISIMNDT